MLKLFNCPTQPNKKRTSVWLPKNMYRDIISILLQTGKSTRDFSSWISNSVINLEKDNNYQDIVVEELLDRGGNISKPISLSVAANEALHIIKNTIIKKHFSFNADINSKIIRTAITQQLIKEEFFMKTT